MTLHQYLTEKDISIAAFGRDLGVSNTSVWKWVHRISLPSGAHMIAIHKDDRRSRHKAQMIGA